MWHNWNLNFHSFNKEEGSLLHMVRKPCPGMGLSWHLRGPDWGTGSPSAPGWDLLMGKDARVCLLFRKHNLALGLSPRPQAKTRNRVISRSLTMVRALGLPGAVAQPALPHS